MIELRPYQQTIIDQVRAGFRAGHRSQLIVSPTGSGKTVMFSFMAGSAASKGLRVWILAHRAELLDQISRTLAAFRVSHGIISPQYPGRRLEQVQVASVFALARRLDHITPPDLIICDEAHHAIATSTWGKIIQAYPKARVIGVTATPVRLSGEGLGDLFQAMVLGPTVQNLIELGSLSPYRMFAPAQAVDLSQVKSRAGDYVRSELTDAMAKPVITGSAIGHYQKVCPGKRAIAFCCSIEHAQRVAQQFQDAGIRAAAIDGNMDRADRTSLTEGFAQGRIEVMTSCDIVSEGYDLPSIETAILLRPTQSLGLYLQQVGRALRPYPGKDQAIILDHAGNSQRHGLPDDDRAWSLQGRDKKSKRKDLDEVAIKNCPMCFSVVRSIDERCRHCGHLFPINARAVEEVEGELSEIDVVYQRKVARLEQGRAQTLDDLTRIGKLRGYKRPEFWAKAVMMGRLKRDQRVKI